ncbi:putative MLO-like protein 1 [Cocos nucifera]|nr:putative MLO-like protein 1 [Cocos nucifera]
MAEGGGDESQLTLEFTPTWIVAVVCSVIVFISLFFERILHYLGKGAIQRTCIKESLTRHMLPCKRKESATTAHYAAEFFAGVLGSARRLLAGGAEESTHCQKEVIIFSDESPVELSLNMYQY